MKPFSKSMDYKVFIEGRAEKDLSKVPKKITRRVVRIIIKFKKNPRPAGVRKISGSANYYRVRVGDWRIVYEINDKSRQVYVFRIRHRKEAYKNL